MLLQIRRILVKLIFKIIPPHYFLDEYEAGRNNLRLTHCSLDEGARFTKTATLHNMQQVKSKIHIGSGSVIEGELLIFKYGGEISIGLNSYVGRNSIVWSGDSIHIGDNVLISHHVNISDTSAHELDHLERSERFKELLTKGHPENKASIRTTPIRIEDFAWINPYSIIARGVTIGKGAIVGAGSVVVKDVAPFTLVAGNPAKFIKALN